MTELDPTIAEQVARVVIAYQTQVSGHPPKAVSVVMSQDALVVTLHGALSEAEKALAKNPEGARKVQEFHRALFASSSQTLREEIQKITGRAVSGAVAEVEPKTGSVIHAFSSGTVVQVYLLGDLGLDKSLTFEANELLKTE